MSENTQQTQQSEIQSNSETETESITEEEESEFYLTNSNDEETYIPIALPTWLQFILDESEEHMSSEEQQNNWKIFVIWNSL